MDNVTVQENTVSQTQEVETAPTQTVPETVNPAVVEPQAPSTQPQRPVEDIAKLNQQVQNLNRALREERRRSAQRGSRTSQGYDLNELDENVLNHPFTQDLLLKTAEFEIKEGVKDILDQYPNLPKYVQKAIIKNPRGFVQPTTTDVQNALLDIQDYIEDIYPEFAQTQTTSPSPKNVPIMGNNRVLNESSRDMDIQQILKIPPEEWTPEQAQIVDRFNK